VTNNTDFSAGLVDDVTTANDPYLDSFKSAIDARCARQAFTRVLN
jgi:hypothetical protein